ncbi:MAG: DHA2 family efflux MFS transporter permease subunit, partial [Alphaproteobacteria bacterium]
IEYDLVKLFLGFSGLVIGQFMAILDIQIVAASIAQIQAGVGATSDEIAWIQTIYLLTEVMVMPMSAYMTRLWGTQPMFLVACVGFMATSVWAGLCSSIGTMILARAIQGLFAGAMIPPVFATAFTAFPPERRMTASVIIGMIVTIAPTIGPTLGGHLTDALSWRWLFFINVPPGLLVLFLVGRWGNFDKGDPALAKGVDWVGLISMSVSLLCLQFVLEEGAKNNWLEDDGILWLTVLSVLAGAAFIWRELTYRQPILNLRLFGNRNFSLGIFISLITGMGLFGGTFILPLYLGQIRGFSASEVGITMLVSGITMFVSGPFFRILLSGLPVRYTISGAFVAVAVGYGLGAHLTDEWGFWEFAALQALRAFGVMAAMISAQQLTMSTLRHDQAKDGSAILNLTRNVGGALGLAMITTTLIVQSRLHYADLSAAMGASAQGQGLLAGMSGFMADRGLADPSDAALKAVRHMIYRNAQVMAFSDAFYWLSISAVVAAVVALFGNPVRQPAPVKPSGVH